MGTADRKAKEKEQLSTLILDSAKKLFIEKGVAQTTIRSIAERIDYSVGTVYLYFKDKNAILNALHTQGFAQLGAQFGVLVHVQNPMERLIAMGRLYIQFALDNPDMYELMFTLKAPMEYLNSVNKEEWQEGESAFNFLKTTVDDCINAGHFKDHYLDPLTLMIWSLVHGLCSLQISQRINGVHFTQPNDILYQAYNEFLKILKKL